MNRSASNSSRARWSAALILVCLGTVAYSNTFHNPFIFDDESAIVNNPQIRGLWPFRPPATSTTVTARPVLIFSFAVNYAIGRLHVEGYHLTNLLIHIAAALLIFGILRRTLLLERVFGQRFRQSAALLSAVVAAIWIVHPLNTESVTFIVQRAESLATVFLLATIYCLIRYVDGGKIWGIAAIVACAMGMGTKENAALAPILAILYDRTFLAGSFAAALRQRWRLYAAMAATWSIAFYSVHSGMRVAIAGLYIARTELNVIAHYLGLAVWPTNLALDYYDWPLAHHWSDVSLAGWLILAASLAFLCALRFKPRLGFLGACFFGLLAPTSSFISIEHEAAAEQRMYFPLAVLIAGIVVGLWTIIAPHRWLRATAIAAAFVAVVLLARLTIDRNQQYASAMDIWSDTVAKRPLNPRAHSNLAQAWARQGLEFPAGSPDAVEAAAQAANQYRIALALEPTVTLDIFPLGQSLDRMGDPLAAERVYTDALANHPEMAVDLLVERGNLRARRGDWSDAQADFLAAIHANPSDVEPHYFLGVVYQQLSDWKDAKSQFELALKLSPNYKDAAARLQRVSQMMGD